MADGTRSLDGKRLVVIGAGSHTGRLLARAAAEAGAELVLAGPDERRPQWTAGELPVTEESVEVARVDLTDEDSIRELAARVGRFDHLISTAALPTDGPVAELELAAARRAFDAKVFGPLMLAKHLGGQVREGGSFTFFSGMTAWRPRPGKVLRAAVDGALAFLVPALAVELAPARVNAIAPGYVDTGAWDALGADKRVVLRRAAERNPVGRIGRPEDLVQAVLYVVTNPYVTGTVLHVDGGGRLV
ncbi:short-chain dehydrogenase [Mangrovactinospora gilvigrisea]|uniref:Short-chain dehydrogenase n=1 Tax=Mangrovactinospora gilvigrisea TaxID=1428644 RepID=A0A1J7CDQ5_9ACTN|nr:SDR family oxidoreductase [Mangrovactinospora gilvigrisea]OIV37794.1 short-chain dehydrogenase [Mangrovactinospora gilvigrisea]